MQQAYGDVPVSDLLLVSVEVKDKHQRIDFMTKLHDLECICYIKEV